MVSADFVNEAAMFVIFASIEVWFSNLLAATRTFGCVLLVPCKAMHGGICSAAVSRGDAGE